MREKQFNFLNGITRVIKIESFSLFTLYSIPNQDGQTKQIQSVKLDVSFPLTCVKSDVFDGNDTDLAPYLNHVLPRDAQNNILLPRFDAHTQRMV